MQINLNRLLPPLLSIVFLLAGIIYYPILNRSLETFLADSKEDILQSLAEDYDLTLQYDLHSTAILSRLELRNIQITWQGQELSIARALVFFNPLRLVRSRTLYDLSASIISMRLDEPTLALQSRPQNISTRNDFVMPRINYFPIIIRMLRVEFSEAQNTVLVDETFLKLTPNYTNSLLQLSFKSKFDLDLNIANRAAEILSSISGAGSISTNFQNINLNLYMQSFNNTYLSLPAQRFILQMNPEKIQLQNLSNLQYMDIKLQYDISAARLEASLYASDLIPAELVTISYNNAILEELSKAKINGSSSFTYDIPSNIWSYELDNKIQLAPYNINFNIKGDGDEEELRVAPISLSTARGLLSFTGNINYQSLLPAGELSIYDYFLVSGISINSSIQLRRASPGQLQLYTDDLRIGNGQNTTVEASVSARNYKYDFSLDMLVPELAELIQEAEAPYATNIAARPKKLTSNIRLEDFQPEFPPDLIASKRVLRLSGKFDPRSNMELLLDFTTTNEDFSSNNLIAMLPSSMRPPPFVIDRYELDDFFIFFNGSLQLDSNSIGLSLPDLTLMNRNNIQRFLSLSALVDNSNWNVNDLYMMWDRELLNASIIGQTESVTVLAQMLESDFNFNVKKQDQIWYLEGDKSLYGQFDTSAFSFSVQEIPIILAGNLASLDLELSGRKTRNWRIFANSINLIIPRNEFSTAQIKMAGSFITNKIDLHWISYDDGSEILTGSGSLDLREQEATPLRGQIDLRAANEHILLSLFYIDDGYLVTSNIEIQLARLLDRASAGILLADLELSGSKEIEALKANYTIRNAYYAGRPLNTNGKLLYKERRLLLSDFDLKFGDLRLNNGISLINLQAGSILSSFDYSISNNKKLLRSNINLNIKMPPIQKLELQEILAADYEGAAYTAPVYERQEEIFPALNIEVSKQENSINIQTEQRERFHFFINLDAGLFALELGNIFPITTRLSGSYKNGEILAGTSYLQIQSRIINYIAPEDPIIKQRVISSSAGIIDGSIKIYGSIFDPEIEGELYLRNVLLTSPYVDSEKHEPINASILAKKHILMIKPFSVTLADGVIHFPGYEKGYIKLKNLRVDRYYLRTELRSTRDDYGGIPISYDAYALKIAGLVSGYGVLEGNSKRGQLAGFINVNQLDLEQSRANNIYEKTISTGSARSRYIFELYLDFKVGNNVTLTYPNKNLPIIESNAKYGDIIQLQITPQESYVLGTMNFPSGSINYGNNSIPVTNGKLVFNEQLPNFDPQISFTSHIINNSYNNSAVDISLSYNGSISNITTEEFNPTISSQPPLTSSELQLLLSSGVSNADSDNALALLPTFISGIGESVVFTPLEKLLQNQLQVDNVTIETHILGNILEDQLQARTSSSSTTQENSLQYLDDTSITIKKYLGPQNAILLSFILDLDYDPLARNTLFSVDSLQIIPGFGLAFNAPFVTVGWEIGLSNVNSLFLPDNKVSIEWSLGHLIYKARKKRNNK